MEDKRSLIIILSITGLIIGLGVVALITSEQESGLDSSKRFTAKPGTERDNSIMLMSRRAPTTTDIESNPDDSQTTYPSHGDATPAAPLRVRTLTTVDETTLNSDELLVREALNSLSVVGGIEKLESALALAETEYQQALYLDALGNLYLQTTPADWDRAEAAWRSALLLTPAPEIQINSTLQLARLLLHRNEPDEASKILSTVYDPDYLETPENYQLGLLLAQSYEHMGAEEKATTVYTEMVSHAIENHPAEPDTIAMVRNAALRLSQYYDKTDRKQEAEQMARALRTLIDIESTSGHVNIR